MKKELLRVGIWNKTVKVSLDRLKTIAKNFNNESGKTIDGYRVPMFLGHPNDPSTAPAKGWLSKVWVKGQSLFGEFADITEEALTEIQTKIFRDVSVGFAQNKLKHVALTNNPAVSNLGDFFANNEDAEILTLSQIQEDNMELAEVMAKNATLEAENKQLNSDVETVKGEVTELTSQLETVNAEKKEVETKLSEKETELAKIVKDSEVAELVRQDKEDAVLVDSIIKDKKVKPVDREITLATFKAHRGNTVELSLKDADGKDIKKSAYDAYKDTLLASAEIIESGEQFKGGPDKGSVKETKLMKLTTEYAAENKCDLASAGIAVLAANPELNVED